MEGVIMTHTKATAPTLRDLVYDGSPRTSWEGTDEA
jgi:hypothetical protein